MGTQFKTVGAGLIITLAITVLLIGLYLAKTGEKGGPLDRGTKAIDQSKEAKILLDSRAAEENAIMNQLP